MGQKKKKLMEANRFMVKQLKELSKIEIPKFILQEKNELKKNKLLFDLVHISYLADLEKC